MTIQNLDKTFIRKRIRRSPRISILASSFESIILKIQDQDLFLGEVSHLHAERVFHHLKAEILHYWTGTRLLALDLKSW